MAKRTGGAKGRRAETSRHEVTRDMGRGSRAGQSRGMGRIGETDDFEAGGEMAVAEAGGRGEREQAFMASARELGGKSMRKARSAAVGVGEAGQQVGGRVAGFVRDNPWPSLLIGAGAAWLAVDAVRGRSDMEIDLGLGREEEGGEDRPGVLRRSVATVADASRGAGEQVTGFVRENPMWAGLAALGIGLAVGMTLPGTVSENKMLGEARDNVVRKARQVASGAAETVRGVARSAGKIAGAGQKTT